MKFLESLRKTAAAGRIPLIPDIKCYSPKDGDLTRGRDMTQVALALKAAGAPVLSVVTEEKEFHGSLALLKKIADATGLPILRKDFIETEADLDKTRAAGADAILLMYACLGRERLHALYQAALKRDLTPLVETHTAEELRWAAELGAPLVGINNRNIRILERDDGDVSLSESLLKTFKNENAAAPFLVVESAIRDGADVRRAIRSGADAVLVGTAILKADDPACAFRRMTRLAGLKICGHQTEDDVRASLTAGADLLGFVTEYPVPVRWNLTAAQAAPLLALARGEGAGSADGTMTGSSSDACAKTCPMTGASSAERVKTCIVTGGASAKVLALARQLRPDFVQLHYTETLAETQEIARALAADGIAVIRSVSGDRAMRKAAYGTDELPEIINLLLQSAVSGILLDSRDAGNAARGGSGVLGEMGGELTPALRDKIRAAGKLLIVGGGITAENAAAVYRTFAPDVLDVMTGAEDADGRKSAERIRQYILHST